MCSTYARLAAALIALGLTATAAADTLDEIQKRGELIFGGDAEGGGPFVFPREDDPTQVQGFEIELASLLAAKLGVKARFSQGQWEKLPDLLERGDIDIVLNGYEWTPPGASGTPPRFRITSMSCKCSCGRTTTA